MPLTTADRQTLLELMPDLGPDCDRTRVLAFAHDRRQELLDELGALPGFDQVRAAALRLLPELEPSLQGMKPFLSACAEALSADLAGAEMGPASQLARHPAWIGLCALELAELQSWPDGGLVRSVELATAAFSASSSQDVGRGEVLWAMAEQAEEAGWTERYAALIEAAMPGPFTATEHAAQVALLVGVRRAEQGIAGAVPILERVAADEGAVERERIQALVVLSQLRQEDADVPGALHAIQQALELLEAGAEPTVESWLRDRLAALEHP